MIGFNNDLQLVLWLYSICLYIFRIRGLGAWCPAHSIDANSYEYLQIDFQEMKVLTVIETQGRFGGGKVSHTITAVT